MLPLNVLSLFDGISCGQVALARAGITVAEYFASEIDENAIKVTKSRYPETVHLGDVKTFNVDALPPIDLMLGGFPCQSHSVGGKRDGLQAETGKLLYDLVRIKNQVKPRYFLFECTYIPKKDLNTINTLIGVKPIKLNSSLVSAQNRRRMYWTNIPQTPIGDRGIKWNKWVYTLPHSGWKAEIKLFEKSPTVITANPGRMYKLATKDTVVPEKLRDENGHWHKHLKGPSPEDCEELQTLSRGYTDVGLSKTARYKAIGNGWTVDLIVELLKGLEDVR